MGIKVEIDDDTFFKAMVTEMKDTIACFEQNLTEEHPNIFFFEDAVKDKAMIRTHIDALNLVISWYEAP